MRAALLVLMVFHVVASLSVKQVRKMLAFASLSLGGATPAVQPSVALDMAPTPVQQSRGPGVDATGLLRPCTGMCLSSQDDRPQHFIPPLCYDGPSYETFAARLVDFIERQIPGSKIVSKKQDNPRYLRVLVQDHESNRFVDELEFYFTPNDNTIQFRFEHLKGKTDFSGTNRRRIEAIVKDLGLDYVPVIRFRKQQWWSFGLDTPFDEFGPSLPYDQDVL